MEPQNYNDVRASIMASLRLGVTVWLFAKAASYYLVFGGTDLSAGIDISDDIAINLMVDQHKISIQSPRPGSGGYFSTHLRVSSLAFNRYKEHIQYPSRRSSLSKSPKGIDKQISELVLARQEDERQRPHLDDLDKLGVLTGCEPLVSLED